tara:strand:- start:58 stop:324 length:267 start_codon:yes stop_codon:yes gene_type:complete
MFKKIIFIFLLLTLTNCSTPGTALIGPIFTGATTKSVARASLSFSSNQVIRKVHETSIKSKKEVTKIVKKIENLDFKSKPKEFFHFYR